MANKGQRNGEQKQPNGQDREKIQSDKINFIVKLQNCYVFLVNRLGFSSIKVDIIRLAINFIWKLFHFFLAFSMYYRHVRFFGF